MTYVHREGKGCVVRESKLRPTYVHREGQGCVVREGKLRPMYTEKVKGIGYIVRECKL